MFCNVPICTMPRMALETVLVMRIQTSKNNVEKEHIISFEMGHLNTIRWFRLVYLIKTILRICSKEAVIKEKYKVWREFLSIKTALKGLYYFKMLSRTCYVNQMCNLGPKSQCTRISTFIIVFIIFFLRWRTSKINWFYYTRSLNGLRLCPSKHLVQVLIVHK